jgi:mevalonate kinase
MQNNFYARGKLMITGEYFVLDGAKSLAIPTRLGQKLEVKKLSGASGNLFWVALNHRDQPWMQVVLNKKNLKPDPRQPESERLAKILSVCRELNPHFLTESEDVAVQTRLEFPANWGLGSSATLIHCLAQWAKVNPFVLLEKTFGGSGYDVACAGSNLPILYYRKDNGEPNWTQVKFEPDFKEQLLLVHLGKKQLSSTSIEYYQSLSINKKDYIVWLNVLTDSMLLCSSLQKFIQILEEHENFIAEALKLQKVKDVYFKNLPVSAKSLGAWGGDFALLAFEENLSEIQKLLREKGFHTVLTWDEMFKKDVA